MLFGGTEQDKLAIEDYHRGLADPDFCPNVVYSGHHPECLCELCFPSDDDPADPAEQADPVELTDQAEQRPEAHVAGSADFADDCPF